MMSREQNVPLLLWISTAIVVHIVSGGGAEQVARVIEDRSELQYFARSIRGKLQPPQAIEVASESLPAKADEPAEQPPDQPADPKQAEKTEKKKKDEQKQPPPPKKAEKKIVLPPMVAAAPAPPPE